YADGDALAVGTVGGAGAFPAVRGITTANGNAVLRTGLGFTANDLNPAGPLFNLGAGNFLLNPGQADPGAAFVSTVFVNAEFQAGSVTLGVPAGQPFSNRFRDQFAVRPSANV